MDDGEYRYARRIVIEAKHQNPRSPVLSHSRPEREFEFYYPGRAVRPPEPRVFSIEELNEDDWKISWELDYRDDFKKVASVVGKEQAAKVLRALKGAVPADWEGK